MQSLQQYEFNDVDAKIIKMMRTRSESDAPWVAFPDTAWEFLEASIASGLKWRIHEDFLAAFITPSSKSGENAHSLARQLMQYSHEAKAMFPSGMGMIREQELGYYRTERDDEGVKTEAFEASHENVPSKDHQLASLMAVFWPDVPPLIWNQVRDLLVNRTEQERTSFMSSRELLAIDHIDFGRAFRFLDHAGKLTPHHVINWDTIINPPLPAMPKLSRSRSR